MHIRRNGARLAFLGPVLALSGCFLVGPPAIAPAGTDQTAPSPTASPATTTISGAAFLAAPAGSGYRTQYTQKVPLIDGIVVLTVPDDPALQKAVDDATKELAAIRLQQTAAKTAAEVQAWAPRLAAATKKWSNARDALVLDQALKIQAALALPVGYTDINGQFKVAVPNEVMIPPIATNPAHPKYFTFKVSQPVVSLDLQNRLEFEKAMRNDLCFAMSLSPAQCPGTVNLRGGYRVEAVQVGKMVEGILDLRPGATNIADPATTVLNRTLGTAATDLDPQKYKELAEAVAKAMTTEQAAAMSSGIASEEAASAATIMATLTETDSALSSLVAAARATVPAPSPEPVREKYVVVYAEGATRLTLPGTGAGTDVRPTSTSLRAVVLKSDGATASAVTWSSANPAVAAISSAGLVTAGTTAGKVTITATAGSATGSLDIEVAAGGLAKIGVQ